MNRNTNTETKTSRALLCADWRTKTAAALLAVIGSVALPQLFHGLGYVSGLGSKLGEAFLPMHLCIFLVGFFAGPWAGLVAGALSPAASFLLTSAWNAPMPAPAVLPYMIVELAVYGLTTGLFAEKLPKVPAFAALLAAQVAGRAFRALALVIGVYGFGAQIGLSTVISGVVQGLPGLALQWALVPLVVFWVRERSKHE